MLKFALAACVATILGSLAYTAGARSTHTPAGVAITGEHRLVVDDAGGIFTYPTDGFTWRFLLQCPPGVPVSLAQESPGSNTYWLLMQSGDVYAVQQILTPGSQWVYQGNALGNAVATTPVTWSRAKSKFRPDVK